MACVECSSWSFKKTEERVCQDPAPSDIPSDLDTELAVPPADDLIEEDEEQYAHSCSVLVISLKTTMEKSRYNVRNILDGHTHCMLV
jgi:hypothetical protein